MNLLPAAEGHTPLAARPAFGEIYANNARKLGQPAREVKYRWVRSGRFKLIVPSESPDEAMLFDVVADREGSFYGNFTFVQGHVAFHPDTSNPTQFGLLGGELGAMDPGRPLLGYVVLPAHIDLARPLDIYWNDLQVTATLRP